MSRYFPNASCNINPAIMLVIAGKIHTTYLGEVSGRKKANNSFPPNKYSINHNNKFCASTISLLYKGEKLETTTSLNYKLTSMNTLNLGI